MKMIRRFMGCIREYKKPTVLTLLCMVGEVAIEVLIPFFTANLVNEIKNGAALGGVVRVGLVLILMSLVSLGCGALGGLFGSRASAGFAKNVRHDVFTRVQGFAFENIDKFSSASLVTRMTTDVSNVQMAFMMCIRIAVRATLMFLFADLSYHHSRAGDRPSSHRTQGHARLPRGVPQVRPSQRIRGGKRPRDARGQRLCP